MKQVLASNGRRAVLTGAALGMLPRWALANSEATVKALVGFPAGGAIDTTARAYAGAMKSFGNVIVENRPGVAGNIAAAALAQAPADGSTLMFAPNNVYCISQLLYSNLQFNTARDFVPVGVAASFPWALTVHPSLPVNSVAELVAWGKSNAAKPQCGMAAVGSDGHLMAYGFTKTSGMPMDFIAYKGGPPMAQDLMAGHIVMAFDPIVNMAAPHKAGKVKVLAVTGAQRTAAAPQVPTFLELGFQGMEGESWIGVTMRRGTPARRVQAVSEALSEASRSPDVRDRLALLGLNPQHASGEKMAEMITADTATYGRLVRELGLKLD